MSVIKAQQIPKSSKKRSNGDDLIAKFCYYFPQYKFNEAKRLPYKRIMQMLNVVKKEQAIFGLEMTKIVAGPHTAKGKGVNKMIEYFKRIIEE